MTKKKEDQAREAFVQAVIKRVLKDAEIDSDEIEEVLLDVADEPIASTVENLVVAQLNAILAVSDRGDEDDDEDEDEDEDEDTTPGSRVVREVLHAVDEKAAQAVRRFRAPSAADVPDADVVDVNEPPKRARRVRL